jgi:hypothetical protein
MVDRFDSSVLDESRFANAQDLRYVKTITDPAQREVVACSILSHRRPDNLAVGDPVPPLDLTLLGESDPTETVNLASVSDQPLVLFFGSFT